MKTSEGLKCVCFDIRAAIRRAMEFTALESIPYSEWTKSLTERHPHRASYTAATGIFIVCGFFISYSVRRAYPGAIG